MWTSQKIGIVMRMSDVLVRGLESYFACLSVVELPVLEKHRLILMAREYVFLLPHLVFFFFREA